MYTCDRFVDYFSQTFRLDSPSVENSPRKLSEFFQRVGVFTPVVRGEWSVESSWNFETLRKNLPTKYLYTDDH